MELNIVCYFDYYPFYQTKKKDMNELDEKISSFFADKSYTELVQSFYIAIIGYRTKRFGIRWNNSVFGFEGTDFIINKSSLAIASQSQVCGCAT